MQTMRPGFERIEEEAAQERMLIAADDQLSKEEMEETMRQLDEFEREVYADERPIKYDDIPEPTTGDQVNHPKHYQYFNGEAMDIIEKSLTTEELIGFWKGNSLKYRIRAGRKQTVFEDIQKAMYYENLYEKFRKDNTPQAGPGIIVNYV